MASSTHYHPIYHLGPRKNAFAHFLFFLASFLNLAASSSVSVSSSSSSSSKKSVAASHNMQMQKHISSHIERTLLEIDRLQVLDFGEVCDSLKEEGERHDLNDLVAKVIRTPTDDLLTQITSRQQALVIGGKRMCNYTKGLACEEGTATCTCYTGHRHSDIWYEVLRENGSCKLDEMSRCYSPSYLVSRGATVIPCVNGARCVGERTGRRCISPLLTENCHCQRPCPDGTFSNIAEELRKCKTKLEEISVLSFGDNCSFVDQVERDEVVASMDRDERAGPIIRGIKRLLATERLLCSPADQLVCLEESGACACGPEKDGILFARPNGSCHWAQGSRCFPEDLYANATGANGSCAPGTTCLLEGQLVPCDPALEEPLCFCQDPDDLESGGLFILILAFIGIVVGGGVVGYLVYSKKISCPPGGSPANV